MRFSYEEAVGGLEHDREFETEAEHEEASPEVAEASNGSRCGILFLLL